MDGDVIRQWLDALDSISYYELFRIDADATPDALRDGFHAFADIFHPDSHRYRFAEEQDAVRRIFMRGTEAYRVLSDPELRVRYDEALAQGVLRPENLSIHPDAGRHRSTRPPGAIPRSEQVRAPGARPFLLRAEELAKKGDPKQAKLQLTMAMHRDPGNAALEAFAKELDEAIRAKGNSPAKSWQK